MLIVFFALFFLSLTGHILAAHRLLKIPCEFSPFFVVSTIITLLYVLAYLGSLRYGALMFPIGFNPNSTPEIPFLLYGTWLIHVLGLVFLVGLAPGLWKTTELRKCLFHPSIFLFLVLALSLFFPMQANRIRKFDDFSQWGMMPKSFLYYDGFNGNDSFVTLPSYLPGSSLFEYYVARICLGTETGYPEGIWAYAMAMMLLSGCAVLGYGSRRFGVPLTFLAGIISLFLFQKGLEGLYVDSMLAVWIGAILFIYFVPSLKKVPLVGRTAIVLPALITLALIKQMGFILAYLTVAVILVDLVVILLINFWAGRESRHRFYHSLTPVRILTTSLMLAMLVGGPALVWKSWDVRIKRINLSVMHNPDSLSEQTIQLFHGVSSQYPIYRWPLAVFNSQECNRLDESIENSFTDDVQTEIFQKEKQAFFRTGISKLRLGKYPLLTPFSSIVILGILSTALLFTSALRENRVRFVFLFCTMTVGFLAYLTLLSLMYLLLTWGPEVGRQLLWYDRFVGTYVHAEFFFFIGFIAYCLDTPRKNETLEGEQTEQVARTESLSDRRWFAFLVGLTIAMALVSVTVPNFQVHADLKARDAFRADWDRLPAEAKSSKSIVLLRRNLDQIQSYMAWYELVPNARFRFFPFTDSSSPDLLQEFSITPEDTLLIFEEDAVAFRTVFESLLDDKAGSTTGEKAPLQLWKIVPNGDSVKLVPLIPSEDNTLDVTNSTKNVE